MPMRTDHTKFAQASKTAMTQSLEEIASKNGDTVIAFGRVTLPWSDYDQLVMAHIKLKRWVDAQMAIDINDQKSETLRTQAVCEHMSAMIDAMEFIHPHLKR